MRLDTVTVYHGEDGLWYWRRTSGWNGQKVATGGEGYVSRGHALAMAKKINQNAEFSVEE